MKKLIFILSLFISAVSQSQTIRGNDVVADKNLYAPVFDTIVAPGRIGDLRVRTQDTAIYLAIKVTAGGKRWTKIAKVTDFVLTDISGKVNISDTSGMLGNYINDRLYGLLKSGKRLYLDSATVFPQIRATIPATDLSAYLTSAIAASTYQPLNTNLTTISGLTATTDNFIQSKSGAWASRTIAQVKTDLGLTGTNSGDQSSIVGITGTTAQFNTALTDNDFATLAGSENLTNKTISGASNTLSNIAQSSVTNLVSDLAAKAPLISPTFVTPILGTATATRVTVSGTVNADSVIANQAKIRERIIIGDTLTAKYFMWYGTSVTIGTPYVSAFDRFSTLVSQSFGATEDNRGISGTRMTAVTGADSSFTNRVAGVIPYFGNYIFLEYGINDFSAGVDTLTFRNSYITALTTLLTTKGYPADHIIMLTPTYRGSGQANYTTATRNIGADKGVQVIDVYTAMTSSGYTTAQYLSSDAIHPNLLGHSILSETIIGNLSYRKLGTTRTKGYSYTEKDARFYGGLYADGGIYIGGDSTLSTDKILFYKKYNGANLTQVGVKIASDTTLNFFSPARINFGTMSYAGTFTPKLSMFSNGRIGVNTNDLGWDFQVGGIVRTTGRIQSDEYFESVNASATNLFAGAFKVTKNGALSNAVILGNGTWFSGGTATTTKPYLLLEPSGTTSNNWGSPGTGLGINSASGFTGDLVNLQVAASSKFKVDYTGNTTAVKYYVSALNTAPSSASDTGTLGEIRVTATFIYVCTATNTWVRTALATW